MRGIVPFRDMDSHYDKKPIPDMVKWTNAILHMEQLDRYIREHSSLEWWHSSVTDKPALISEAPTRRLVKVA